MDITTLEAKLAAVTAERDAHAATIGRVRDVVGQWAHVYDYEDAVEWLSELRAALDPKPTFALPTEVPARIMAEPKEDSSIEYMFVLWSDGNGGQSWWLDFDDSSGELYSPERLMREFTNHRLLDGAE